MGQDSSDDEAWEFGEGDVIVFERIADSVRNSSGLLGEKLRSVDARMIDVDTGDRYYMTSSNSDRKSMETTKRAETIENKYTEYESETEQ